MKLLFLLLTISLPSFALNETMLNMPPDKAYMGFVLKKFLRWHRTHFKFPEESRLIDDLVGGVDHWLVKGSVLRQFTITHGVQAGKYFQKVRFFVAPELRNKKEFVLNGQDGERLRFIELDDSGTACLLFSTGENTFSSWCRKKGERTFTHSWDEELAYSIPEKWPVPFPVLGREVLKKTVNNVVTEIGFFQVSPHPSGMPKPLLLPVYLNTRDPLFPLDRVSTTRDGGMSVQYP